MAKKLNGRGASHAPKKKPASKSAAAPVQPLYRFFEFDRAQLNESERTVPVSFSSEHPVDRGDYMEVLDHTKDGIDLARMNDGHPLLLNHDPDKQIGVVQNAELSESEKKGRAVIRFGNSNLAEEIFRDVKDRIRRHLSVGYERIRTMTSEKLQDGRSLIRFAWRPFELSIVPVPADPNVGVGRNQETRTMANMDCAAACQIALTACNSCLGEIEDCDLEADAAHQQAANSCYDAIASLAICIEDLNFWSEATAADCVEACVECAAMCDQAVSALRAVGSCPHCGADANQAIEELEEAAEECRENAGIEPINPAAAAEAETEELQETNSSVETRSGVDTAHSPNADAKSMTPKILLDPTPAAGGGGTTPPAPTIDVEAVRKSALDTERARVKNIRAAAETIAKDWPEGADKFRAMANDAVDKGETPENFNAQLLAAIPGMRKATVVTAESLGMTRREVNAYSLGRAIQSVLKRPGHTEPEGLEGEVHKAMGSRSFGKGVEAGGFWVPFDMGLPVRGPARRDLNVTTFGQGGAFVQTTILTPIIEILRNRLVTARLGVQPMSGLEGNVAIPRQTGAATAYSLAESATLTKSTQALDQIVLSPHRVGTTNDYTKQLLLQSSVDVENFIRDDLMKILAIKWDKLILEGSGAGSEPTGILHTTGIGSVTFGQTATFAKMVAFETALALANADLGAMAYVTTPSVRAALKVTPKVGTTFPIFIWEDGEWADGSNDGDVNSYRAAATNQIANNAVAFGHWADAIGPALWGGFDVVVNPYSRDVDAVVRITVNTFGDVAVRHAASFAWSSDAGNQ